MKNKFLLKIKNTLFVKVFQETPVLRFASLYNFDKKAKPHIYVKSNLYGSNHHILLKPYKSICREV